MYYVPLSALTDSLEMTIEDVLNSYENISFTRQVEGKGGYINAYVLCNASLSIEERGSLLMEIEDKLVNKVNKSIRIWHEPIGDKNSLRQIRGVTFN